MKIKEYIQKIREWFRKRRNSSKVELERIDNPNAKADARITFSSNERCEKFRRSVLAVTKGIKIVEESKGEDVKEPEELQQ